MAVRADRPSWVGPGSAWSCVMVVDVRIWNVAARLAWSNFVSFIRCRPFSWLKTEPRCGNSV